jgi:cell division protease FtsH
VSARARSIALWIVIIAVCVIVVLLALALFTLFQSPSEPAASENISLSELFRRIEGGQVRELHGTFQDGRRFSAKPAGW